MSRSYDDDSVASLVGALIARLIWIYTAVVFLLKLTRWIDWSWWTVFAPLFWSYVAALALFTLGKTLQAIGGRKRSKAMGYAMPDLSHIEPLDSIKNPRKS